MIRALSILFPLFSLLVSCNSFSNTHDTFQFNTTTAEEVGFHADSLQAITQFLADAADSSKIPGAVAMIVKDGQIVYHEAVGYSDIQKKEEMRTDRIFRIASMSKAITSLGVLILDEQGALNVEDRVSKYIPEFANPTVVESVNFSDSTWSARNAEREVTIHDLLTHTSGIAYGFIDSTMNALYKKNGVPDGINTSGSKLAEAISSLGELPLKHDPGQRWTYGLSSDVLGRVIEVASGEELDDFFKTTIFDPLGMDDTGFYLTPEKADRLVPMYRNSERNELIQLSELELRGSENTVLETTPNTEYFSGGAGLMSTAEDYQRFMQTILNDGLLGDTRLYGEITSERLKTHQLDDLRVGRDGFSYGFLVTFSDGDLSNHRKPGRLQWGGLYQTLFWMDPVRDVSVVLMTQVYPSYHQGEIYDGFERRVNQAFIE